MKLNNIGKWKIYAIETGLFSLDGGAMMGSVPKVLWEKTNPADELNRIQLALRCLLLDDGKNRILIESGMGDKLESSFKERFHVEQPKYPLKEKLPNRITFPFSTSLACARLKTAFNRNTSSRGSNGLAK